MAREIQEHPTAPDELTAASAEAGEWGLPSDEGAVGQHAGVIPQTFDYAGGILVGHGLEYDADAVAAQADRLIPARVDSPRAFELPHEPTHRRYEPPRVVSISQTVAGVTMLVPGNGLQYVKLLALAVTLDQAGTLSFVQGNNAGTSVAAMTGTINMGAASAPILVLPPAPPENPWLFTSPDQAFGIRTVTGFAQGWAMVAYSPYDQ